ncbi:MAG: hypothetical protein RJA07_2013 [Bacteroidota bacterium]|jgi:hypothetical protein
MTYILNQAVTKPLCSKALRQLGDNKHSLASTGKYFIIILLIATCQIVIAQNFISNGSFEKKDSCYFLSIYKTGWMYSTTFGSPDYYCRCFNGINSNNYGVPLSPNQYQYPKDGNCFMGFGFISANGSSIVYEYIENKLISPLTIGKKYHLVFYLNSLNYDRINNPSEPSIIAINKIELLLSSWQLADTSSFSSSLSYNRLDYKPQLVTNYFITDTFSWHKVSFDFVADSNYRYITFGCFEKEFMVNKQVILSPLSPTTDYSAYYNIDDVSLVEDTSSGVGDGVREVESRKLIVYPNPASQSIVISHQSPKLNWEVNTIEVTNLLGQKQNIIVEKLTTENCLLKTANLPSGIYFIKATDVNGNVMNGKFVKE